MNSMWLKHRTALQCAPVVGLALIALSGCMATPSATLKDAPKALAPPENQALVISARGAGVQIYTCLVSKTDSASFAWDLTAPDAVLRYETGKELGKHYAGPTWQANDGSTVVGEVVARAAAADTAAIPWLLLRAKSTSGSGVFSGIRFIQRLHTVGGNAPATGCDAAYAGAMLRVDYSADYYFYGDRH